MVKLEIKLLDKQVQLRFTKTVINYKLKITNSLNINMFLLRKKKNKFNSKNLTMTKCKHTSFLFLITID